VYESVISHAILTTWRHKTDRRTAARTGEPARHHLKETRRAYLTVNWFVKECHPGKQDQRHERGRARNRLLLIAR
jgi:hypothetical protein